MFNNEIIAMSIILFINQKMHYHLSAFIRLYSKAGAYESLLYEAACWGFANNFKTFHLGGGCIVERIVCINLKELSTKTQ